MTRRRKTKPVVTGAVRDPKHVDKYKDKADATRAKRNAQREKPSVLQIQAERKAAAAAAAETEVREKLGLTEPLPKWQHEVIFGAHDDPTSVDPDVIAARVLLLDIFSNQHEPDADPV